MKPEAVWRAVADPTRRRIIELLRDGPRTTGELCRSFSTTRFAVMKHLRVLEQAGIVAVRRAGRDRWNVLDPEPLRALAGRWPGGWSSRECARGGRTGLQKRTRPSRRRRAATARISVEVFIDAATWRVFDALTVNIAAWWGAPHLGAADASNLLVEPQPGGRFIEEWGHRQGTLRGVVTAIRQDERLAMAGAVLGRAGAELDVRLERREGGTLLTARLSQPSGRGEAAGAASDALDDLFRVRLKAFVETGTRSGVSS